MNTMTFSLQDVDIPSIAEAISRAGFTGIDLRDSHIQDYLQAGHSMQEIKNLLKEYKLHPIAIHALRDWQKAEDKKGEKYWESVEQYFDMSRKMNCEFSVCAAWAQDGDVDGDIRGFKEICDIARLYDTRVALEFLPWARLKDVKMAWEVIERANCSNGGLLIDTFHYFKGGSRMEALREVPAEKIFFVHLDDAPDLPIDSEEMGMNHRVFPGEGVFPLREFLDVLLTEKQYKGWIVLEVLNRENQNIDYVELAKKGKECLERLLHRYQSIKLIQ
jgi:sugar phosphate isomerase/epimerase